MRQITKIILHCSATPEHKPFTIQDITRWHKERGFRTIGYHYVIYLDGTIHPGRPEHEVGAHCQGHNTQSIGICYIGGLTADGKRPKDTRTQAQKEALQRLVADLRQRYPQATVHGHSEYANKSCPCFDVQKEFKM